MTTESAIQQVMAALIRRDPDRSRTACVLRETLDQLYDGQHTGRYRWDQLYKTEKTHCGTLVEINLQREFRFDDGTRMDYRIAGQDVDCKYSQTPNGWMIPLEAVGEICLLVTASDAKQTWSAGLVRALPERLNLGKNRDSKATLNSVGRAEISWFAKDAPLPPNALLALPDEDLDAVFAVKSGQGRINELFRRAQGQRISRAVVATVAQQDDYMKRVRGNGGARQHLREEGIVIFGDYGAHRELAAKLGLPPARRGESVSARLSRADFAWSGPAIELAGERWRLWTADDHIEQAPELPRVAKAARAPL